MVEEKIFYMYYEEDARDLCWKILKLGEKAKIDSVSPTEDEYVCNWKINCRFWDPDELDALEKEYYKSMDEKYHTISRSPKMEDATKILENEMKFLKALLDGNRLKRKLIDDREAWEIIDELVLLASGYFEMDSDEMQSSVENGLFRFSGFEEGDDDEQGI